MEERAAAQTLRQLFAQGKVSRQELRAVSAQLRQQGQRVTNAWLLQCLLATGRVTLAEVGSRAEELPTARLGEAAETLQEVDNLFASRFRDLKLLGSGGMGQVYQAFDTLLQRPVAIKVLASQGRGLAPLLAEAQAQAAVEHPHVCPIYDVVEREGRGYVVMRYVPGQSLLAYQGRLSPQQVAEVGVQVAQALEAAHRRGLVHRDVKPANVLVEEVGGQLQVSVVDFGLSQEKPGTVAGTPGYLAPEVAQGAGGDERADVFGLGATLYQLLAGHPPQQAPSLLALVQELSQGNWQPPPLPNPPFPEDLAWILRKALAPNPQDRYPSAGALAQDLQRFLRGEPVSAHPPTWSYALRGFFLTHRRQVGLFSLALMVLAVFTVAGRAVWQARRQGELASRLQAEVAGVEERFRSVLTRPRHAITQERQALLAEVEKAAAAAAQAGLAQESLWVALGRAALSLGALEKALGHLEKAQGSKNPPPAAQALLGAAVLAQWEGEWARVAQLPQGEMRRKKEQDLQALETKARSLLLSGSGPGQGTLARARLAYLQRRWQEAAELSEASRGETPWVYDLDLLQGKAFLAWARELFAQGQYSQAEERAQKAQESFRRALALAPSHPQAYLGLAQAFFEEANARSERGVDPVALWQQAAEKTRQALAVDPEESQGTYLLAMAFLRQGDYHLRRGQKEGAAEALERALAVAEELVQREPQRSWGWTLAGIAWRLRAELASQPLQRQEWEERARRALQEALRRDGQDLLAANNLGLLLLQQGLAAWRAGAWPEAFLAEGEELFAQLARLFPSNTVLLNWSALALTRAHVALLAGHSPAESLAVARQALAQALAANPADAAALNNQGLGFLEEAQWAILQGQEAQELLAQADGWLKKVEAVNPADPVLPENRLRWLALRLQELEPQQKEALELWQEGQRWRKRVVAWEESVEAQAWWALLAWEAGRCLPRSAGRRLQQEAWESWRKARALEPHSPDLLLLGCAFLAAQDNPSPGKADLRNELRRSPYPLLQRCGEKRAGQEGSRRKRGCLWGLAP